MSQLEDLVAALDAETTAVSHKIDNLKAELAAALADGKAPAQSTIDALSAISNRLKALGSDPSDPIPAPVVEAPAAPAAPAAAVEAPVAASPSDSSTTPSS